tara:strand:- start:380 stop:604 length:225 start_codon:yes stop_codon:yes gene_type:complete
MQGLFLPGIVIGLYVFATGDDSILEINSFIISLIVIPFGVSTACGFREMLRKNWEKNPMDDQMLLDAEVIDEDS